VERKNTEIEQARLSLEDKAEQLALTSKYKSEFLANMSHELRTPLNSLLILSNLLKANSDGNLTTQQVNFSETIHEAGSDLLAMITDILDLAKIESGTISIDVDEFYVCDLVEALDRIFRQVATTKKLEFKNRVDPKTPKSLSTDLKRLQQVMKNMLSNSFKFTEYGSVTIQIEPVKSGWDPANLVLNQAETVLSFSVIDTGIGIAPEKQKIIFEAFQQADGSTSRKYGGTGLGLPISREISSLLGGDFRVNSTTNEGSTFTLYLPQKYVEPTSKHVFSTPPSNFLLNKAVGGMDTPPIPGDSLLLLESAVADDRGSLQEGDHILLIVEYDLNFARILLDESRDHGFKGIVASTGEAAMALAIRFNPDGITLDLQMPYMEGWTVLDRLKHDSKTRHIPVYVLSALSQQQRALRQGAFGYIEKPATREVLGVAFNEIKDFIERSTKSLLVVDHDQSQRNMIMELISDSDVECTGVGSAAEAVERLQSQHFDCIVIDPNLPDMNGIDLIRKIQQESHLEKLPIIVYTSNHLEHNDEIELKNFTKKSIVKNAHSPDRLFDETALFLHRVASKLPDAKRRILNQAHAEDSGLAGRKVLVVDDDVRNIFALTSILEVQNMNVIFAHNGHEAIKLLEDNSDVDIILMDIMMPGIDGYETMRRIREVEKYRALPIIALTAKAMKGDREKCIDAGASDYIAKPVNTEHLKSLLRVWLYR
jgi:CheY-like chemotaxis protein/nitrogen-specific signal transduction histidine kinase